MGSRITRKADAKKRERKEEKNSQGKELLWGRDCVRNSNKNLKIEEGLGERIRKTGRRAARNAWIGEEAQRIQRKEKPGPWGKRDRRTQEGETRGRGSQRKSSSTGRGSTRRTSKKFGEKFEKKEFAQGNVVIKEDRAGEPPNVAKKKPAGEALRKILGRSH